MGRSAPGRPGSPGPPLAGALLGFGLFGLFAWSALRGGWTDLDAAAATRLQAGAPARGVMALVSAWHAPRAILALSALAAVLLYRCRGLRAAASLPTVVLGGAALNHVIKHALQRPRPGLEHLAGVATDFALPSGHTTNAMLLYGTFAWLMLGRAASGPLRWGAAVAALAMVALVASSRVVLGAHRLSDVVAAVPLALGWMLLCLAVARAVRGADLGRMPR
jgi:membrane-associated phospholipid phosphatase